MIRSIKNHLKHSRLLFIAVIILFASSCSMSQPDVRIIVVGANPSQTATPVYVIAYSPAVPQLTISASLVTIQCNSAGETTFAQVELEVSGGVVPYIIEVQPDDVIVEKDNNLFKLTTPGDILEITVNIQSYDEQIYHQTITLPNSCQNPLLLTATFQATTPLVSMKTPTSTKSSGSGNNNTSVPPTVAITTPPVVVTTPPVVVTTPPVAVTNTPIPPATSNFTQTPAGKKDCSDGVDNDGDTYIDFPFDPECNNANDPSEGK